MRGALPALQDAYAQALERAPDDAEIEWLMGRMYRALAKAPDYGPSLYERAVLHSKAYRRDYRAAYESMRALAAGPEAGRRYEPITREQVEAARLALRELREAIERDIGRLTSVGDEAQRKSARGMLAYYRGEYAQARRLLAEAVEQEPLLEEAWETLGQAALAQADLAGAEEARLKAWERAEEIFTEGHRHDQGYLPHLLGRGDVRLSRGVYRMNRGEDPLADWEAAEADFTESLRLNRESAEAWMGRGLVRNNRGAYRQIRGEDPLADYEAAEADDTESLRLNRESAEAWMRRGDVRRNRAGWRGDSLAAAADYAAAADDYAQALKLNPALKSQIGTRLDEARRKAREGEEF